MNTDRVITTVRQKYQSLVLIMDERVRRRWAASEAVALGWGGITAVAEATGLSPTTIRLGIAESRAPRPIRAPIPTILMSDARVVGESGSPRTVPWSPTWRPWSVPRPGETPSPRYDGPARAHESWRRSWWNWPPVSHQTSGPVFQESGYNLQVNRKNREGDSHPDRDAQFEYIAKQVRSAQRRGQPVVSVDTKKELIGDFRNVGREWQPEGSPEEVRCKDFKDKELGKVAPYGVYDRTTDKGWVSVGINHDTAQFATETLRRWWSNMGIRVYPRATDLLVTADGGGSNSSRSRLWKVALQGLTRSACGLPCAISPRGPASGTRSSTACSAISRRIGVGEPLVSRAVVVNLIGSTKTRTGLRINAELDTNTYKIGLKVTDEEFATIKIKRPSSTGSGIIPSHQIAFKVRKTNA